MKKKAEKLIAELEEEMNNNIFLDLPKAARDVAILARIGALQLAVLKIKIAFGLPLID